MGSSPLSGVRVLDLTRALAGPFCGRVLADFGAEVIKVEPPGGDNARQFEYLTPEGVSGYFMQQNCGKQDICVDLAHPGAKEAVWRLVTISDVVVENFRPGVMERLGLGFPQLVRLNPTVILCSISAFGQTGRYAHRPGGDMIIQSMSGLASLTGDPDGPPQTTGMALTDTTGGLHAFGAICAALYRRSSTGKGERIDISLLECVVWQNEWASQHYFLSHGKVKPTRYGNRRPILSPGNLFRGKDGYVTVVTSTDPGWENLTRAMGMSELAIDPRFANREGRHANRDELERIVQQWVASFDSVDQVEEVLADRSGVQAAKVRSWPEMIEDELLRARGLVTHVQDPVLGPTPVMNSPFNFDTSTTGVRGPAPLLGEHTLGILKDLLGYRQADIFQMLSDNALHADDQVMARLAEALS